MSENVMTEMDNGKEQLPPFMVMLYAVCKDADMLAHKLQEGEVTYKHVEIAPEVHCVKAQFIPQGSEDKMEEWPPAFRLFAAGVFTDRRGRETKILRCEKDDDSSDFEHIPYALLVEARGYAVLSVLSLS